MAIIVSRGCEYGLQAMLYLATQPANQPVLQRDISRALNIPPHFLGKVLQSLVHSGLLASSKGKNGGFYLAVSPLKITPYDIIMAIDGPVFLNGCLLGFPGCDDHHPCPIHAQWKPIKEKLIATLKNKSIAQLSHGIDAKLEFIRVMSNHS